jgi:hypothetical protein
MGIDDLTNYTHGEARTLRGELVQFTCHPDIKDKIMAAITKLRSIKVAITHQVEVPHGGYVRYSRYDLKQHRYVGYEYGLGYVELLEICNAPDNRCPYVIWRYMSDKVSSVFYEFETLEAAIKAWNNLGPTALFEKQRSNSDGFIRHVPCSGLDPWFYAVGDQTLYKDFVFPDGLEEDQIFRILKKYVVNEVGFPTIKTCLGMITIDHELRNRYEQRTGKTEKQRIVYWDDGTCWDERYQRHTPPRPLQAEELWIDAAMHQFRDLLSGKTTEFTIEFQDGHCFVGRLVDRDILAKSLAGKYEYRATLDNGVTLVDEHEFRPTGKTPTIKKAIERIAKKEHPNAEIINLDIRRYEEPPNQKGEWTGVFPSTEE